MPSSSSLCVVCSCIPAESSDCYHIYVVDFPENKSDHVEFRNRSPTLRFGDSIGSKVFCVLGSTLYMFDASAGINSVSNVELRSVLSYPLPSSKIFNLQLEKSDLAVSSVLNHHKLFPLPIPTPDGKKILLLDGEIQLDNNNHCEIYDSAIGSWRTHRGFGHALRDDVIRVEAHTFIDDHVLLIQTQIGTFVFNTQLPNQPFMRLYYDINLPAPLRLPSRGRFITIPNLDLFLTPYQAYDIGKGEIFFIPNLSSMGSDYRGTMRKIALVHLDAEQCKFCIVQSEIHEITQRPHLIMNLYCIDLVEYAREREETRLWNWEDLPATTVVQSLKFRGRVDALDDFFSAVDVFHIAQLVGGA